MTKAEKAMADKISMLLLSDDKSKVQPLKAEKAPKPSGKLTKPMADSAKPKPKPTVKIEHQLHTASPINPAPLPGPGVIPIPEAIHDEVFHTSPQPSGAATPIIAMAAVHAAHIVDCSHDTASCSICQFGITCCSCSLIYIAPASKRMRCSKCLHWACDHDQSNECCTCSTFWPPSVLSPPSEDPVPSQKEPNPPAACLHGGAGSDNNGKGEDWSSSGSSAHTAEESTVKIKISGPTQESIDEIDALSKPSAPKSGSPPPSKGSTKCPRPKPGPGSREPSRPSSAASDLLSVTETVLPKPDYEVPPLIHKYKWSLPPADIKSAPGYTHPGHKDAILHANVAVQSLLRLMPTLPNVTIVQGDFNLHSLLWDANIQRGSGVALQLYLELSDLGMNLLNNEDEPTWANGRGSESVIDLLFVSDRLCPLDPFVEMSMDNRGRSDHALISCLFGTQLLRPGTPYIAKDSEEEDEFCFFLGSLLAAIPDSELGPEVEGTCSRISGQISEKWSTLAKMPITSRPHSASWWNDECQAYRDVYNISRTKDNLKAYNAVTRKARTAFFEAKIAVMMAIKKPWEGVHWTWPRPPPPYSTIEVDGAAPKDVCELFNIMHVLPSSLPLPARRRHSCNPWSAGPHANEGLPTLLGSGDPRHPKLDRQQLGAWPRSHHMGNSEDGARSRRGD